MKNIRTRFAPSPTGYLHVGGARTALYCYLQARAKEGVFVLRIEDTDLERSTPESVQAILNGMAWLDLDYDEGPYYQTQRFDRYGEVLQQLLQGGKAYRCYCSKQRLEQLREEQKAAGLKPRYDGRCRDRTDAMPGQDYVIRFRNPANGEVVFDDLVRGKIVVANTELDDLIIARSDGSPTYNFTVVVDDMDMQITHVIRGDDHINNTPRQINIYQALDVSPPVFAHVPMILGDDGARLSKRHGAVSVLQYRDAGYLPQALLNYLVRLGWSHGDQEVFDRQQMVDLFDIAAVNKKASAFNCDKLNWLNQHYLRSLPATEVASHLAHQFELLQIDPDAGPPLANIVPVLAERVKTLREMAEQAKVFFTGYTDLDQVAAKKHLRPVAAGPLQRLREELAQLDIWEAPALQQVIDEVAAELELKLGKVAQPLRVAVTGCGVSPAIDQTLWLMGRERALQGLDKALAYIAQRVQESSA